MASTYFRNMDMNYIDANIHNLNLLYDIFLFAGVDRIVLELRAPNDKLPPSIYDHLLRFTKLFDANMMQQPNGGLLNKFFRPVRNEEMCRMVNNLWIHTIQNTEIVTILRTNNSHPIQYFLQDYPDISDQDYVDQDYVALENILRAFVKFKDTGALVYLVNEYHNELVKYINLGLVGTQKKIIENTLNQPANQSSNSQILDKCARYNRIINILLE